MRYFLLLLVFCFIGCTSPISSDSEDNSVDYNQSSNYVRNVAKDTVGDHNIRDTFYFESYDSYNDMYSLEVNIFTSDSFFAYHYEAFVSGGINGLYGPWEVSDCSVYRGIAMPRFEIYYATVMKSQIDLYLSDHPEINYNLAYPYLHESPGTWYSIAETGYFTYTLYGTLYYGPTKVSSYTAIDDRLFELDGDTLFSRDYVGGAFNYSPNVSNTKEVFGYRHPMYMDSLKWTYYDKDTYTWAQK